MLLAECVISPTVYEGSISSWTGPGFRCEQVSVKRRHDAGVLLGRQLRGTVRSSGSSEPGVLVCPRGCEQHQQRTAAHFITQKGRKSLVMRTKLTGSTWAKESNNTRYVVYIRVLKRNVRHYVPRCFLFYCVFIVPVV